ncbi:MAG: peptidase M64 [Planctomycetes bacterium]|nr:peptidase M64 [Planctomycetota bacterium]
MSSASRKASAAPQESSAFDARFTGATLRFDYHHTGCSTEEHIAPAGFRLEGAWPGSRGGLLDDSNTGRYLFVVEDAATHTPLYSRGFCSVYGEWETTGEAKRTWRAIEESQRFPEPRKPVELVLEKREESGGWKEISRTSLDPASRFVDRSPIAHAGELVTLSENAPPAHAVDLLILADGYTASEQQKFVGDAKRLIDVMFSTPPYDRHARDFNVRLLFVSTPQSGISNPRKDVWHESVYGLSFNAFDSDRYVLTLEDRKLRELAAQAPYDALILLFNDRKYGGGGIYNLWCTCAADTEPAAYIFVHEFGHSFAGLADEYYTSQVSYEDLQPAESEPWEPNVTRLANPARLKWGDLVATGTPLPTPWRQAEYDAADLAYQKKRAEMIAARAPEEASEQLMREVKLSSSAFLQAERWFGKVGAFEGAMYEAKGLYRPEPDCIMFTRNPTRFCHVCERAVEQAILRQLR